MLQLGYLFIYYYYFKGFVLFWGGGVFGLLLPRGFKCSFFLKMAHSLRPSSI
jgi:hypothetical protein